jgi:hypothetical protein
MKKKSTKILPFPPPPPEPGSNTIIAQIGSSRFAILFEIEDLPPALPTPPPQLLLLKQPAKKRNRVE